MPLWPRGGATERQKHPHFVGNLSAKRSPTTCKVVPDFHLMTSLVLAVVGAVSELFRHMPFRPRGGWDRTAYDHFWSKIIISTVSWDKPDLYSIEGLTMHMPFRPRGGATERHMTISWDKPDLYSIEGLTISDAWNQRFIGGLTNSDEQNLRFIRPTVSWDKPDLYSIEGLTISDARNLRFINPTVSWDKPDLY